MENQVLKAIASTFCRHFQKDSFKRHFSIHRTTSVSIMVTVVKQICFLPSSTSTRCRSSHGFVLSD